MLKKKAARKDPVFTANEKLNQQTSKQNARKKPGVLAKERAEKQSAREDPTFNAKEIDNPEKTLIVPVRL